MVIMERYLKQDEVKQGFVQQVNLVGAGFREQNLNIDFGFTNL